MPGNRPLTGRRSGLCSLLILSICIAGGRNAFSQGVSEYAVKAAFVYNFTKFVSWPAGTFKDENSPITICVLGENPFANALNQIVEGKTFNGRTFAVKYIGDVNQERACQILFISRSERKRLGAILDSLGKPSVLTVGDTDGFAKQGIMINLYLEAGKVRFEINPDAAARAGISISSKLLGLAKIVKE